MSLVLHILSVCRYCTRNSGVRRNCDVVTTLWQDLCRFAVWAVEAIPAGEVSALVGNPHGASSTQLLEPTAGTPTR